MSLTISPSSQPDHTEDQRPDPVLVMASLLHFPELQDESSSHRGQDANNNNNVMSAAQNLGIFTSPPPRYAPLTQDVELIGTVD